MRLQKREGADMERMEKNIVIDTDTSYRGNSDAWISLEYFHQPAEKEAVKHEQ